MKTIDDLNFENKKELIRVDCNVPVDASYNILDDPRILAAKPTVDKNVNDRGTCIVMPHLDRPEAKEAEFPVNDLVACHSELFNREVEFSSDCIGSEAEEKVKNLKPGGILLLENLRFHKEETAGDSDFAKALAQLGDCYVNDAFGTAHRAHASTAIIAEYFPNNKFAGYLLASEVENVKKVLEDNVKPVTAIIGGAKVSSKITIIENILGIIDHLIIGGGMAFTFIKAQGEKVGDSLVEDDKQELALQNLKMAEEKNVKVHLPIDSVVADKFSEDAQTAIQPIDAIDSGWMGLDVGPKTNELFENVIRNSKTILWNGPVGVFEMEKFSNGTKSLGKAVAQATDNGAFSLVGGGDSVAAVKQFGLAEKVSYVSTGGGAMLEMLEGKTLPGIAALA